MKLRPAVCILVFFLAAVLLTSPASAQAAPEKQKIICDHAAPPRGMHYVCKSQCDCHLEGKLKNDEDGVAPATVDDPNQQKACKYDAPKLGELLVCDSECKCRPYIPLVKKTKNNRPIGKQ